MGSGDGDIECTSLTGGKVSVEDLQELNSIKMGPEFEGLEDQVESLNSWPLFHFNNKNVGKLSLLESFGKEYMSIYEECRKEMTLLNGQIPPNPETLVTE